MTFYGCEHSLFYPYDSFLIINILFYAQSAFYPDRFVLMHSLWFSEFLAELSIKFSSDAILRLSGVL